MRSIGWGEFGIWIPLQSWTAESGQLGASTQIEANRPSVWGYLHSTAKRSRARKWERIKGGETEAEVCMD